MVLEKSNDIYNKIVKYHEFSDNLMKEIENSASATDFNEKATILLPIAKKIKSTADSLIENYIAFINDENDSSAEPIKKLIDELIKNIEICKVKVYEIYRTSTD